MARFGKPAADPMMRTALNVGEPTAAPAGTRDFTASPSNERTPMKNEYDYLATPLAALRGGDATRAIRMLEELVVVKPELVEVTYHLARAWQSAGDAEKARGYYLEVLADARHPFHAHARVRLSELGGAPPAGNGGVVPQSVAEQTGSEAVSTEAPAEVLMPESATAQAEAPAAEAGNGGVVPEHVAEETNSAAVSTEAPAPAHQAKGKGKKAKATEPAPEGGAGQEGASS